MFAKSAFLRDAGGEPGRGWRHRPCPMPSEGLLQSDGPSGGAGEIREGICDGESQPWQKIKVYGLDLLASSFLFNSEGAGE